MTQHDRTPGDGGGWGRLQPAPLLCRAGGFLGRLRPEGLVWEAGGLQFCGGTTMSQRWEHTCSDLSDNLDMILNPKQCFINACI